MTDTAFPRVTVVSIQVRQLEGEGRKRPRAIAQFFAPEDEGRAIERATGILTKKHKLVYHLNIQAASERGARATGRTFVRSQNIFEPSIISVDNVNRTSGEGITERFVEAVTGSVPDNMDNLPSITDTYSVNVSVEK